MKKLISVFVLMALFTVSCEKIDDEPDTPKEYVVKGDGLDLPENTIIRVYPPGIITVDDSVAEGIFVNGGFELTLPATLPENILRPVDDVYTFPNASVSDHAAQIAIVSFVANSEYIPENPENIFPKIPEGGTLLSWDIISLDDSHLRDRSYPSKEAVFIYADRSVKVSGERSWLRGGRRFEPPIFDGVTWVDLSKPIEYTTTYDLELKPGWNMVCLEQDYDSTGDPHKSLSAYSMKKLDGCKWNIVEYSNEIIDRWRPKE